jgi:hypothetical protein
MNEQPKPVEREVPEKSFFRKKPNFVAWLLVILPGLIARGRFGGLGAFRGMAGAILTVFFTIGLIRIVHSDSARPERLPVGISVLGGLIVLSLLLVFWGYRTFCRTAAKGLDGDKAERGTD